MPNEPANPTMGAPRLPQVSDISTSSCTLTGSRHPHLDVFRTYAIGVYRRHVYALEQATNHGGSGVDRLSKEDGLPASESMHAMAAYIGRVPYMRSSRIAISMSLLAP